VRSGEVVGGERIELGQSWGISGGHASLSRWTSCVI
jgi:hypothetical protein